MNAAHAGPALGPPDARRPWRALIAVLPFLLAFAAVATVFWTLRDRMPDPLAVHFTADGTGDGVAAASDFLMTWAVVPLVFGAVIGVLVHRDEAAGALRWAIGTGYGLAGLFGCLGVSNLLVNADADDASAVRFPMTYLVMALGVAVLSGAVGWLCAGPDRVRADKVAGPSRSTPALALGDGERASWSRTVGSPALLVLGPGLLVAGVFIGVSGSWAGAAVFAVVCLLCVAFAGVRVTVDHQGLTVASSVVSRPRLRIPVARVAEAGVQRVSPLVDFGGWGYRIRSGRSGIVLRAGEALALRLTNGRVFLVTVDDAATAAALLNALAARTHTTGSGPGPGSGSGSGQGG
ncbi:hypothetical protein OEIGOIKO_01823 [Streptomyces chrestomyceticus JCM 4735]|uniref:DUF1648 domain-containing protein n=1 Tax=Streptomyces chrestomyceticus JCM 4735 TaxID=1306181 RepID=A0A7U9KT39_9ACTN|nr:DUF1648 domain-containing protein [Streptomyces chrestomyceticus]GCD34098.1 hypothetical protein OEIGOIKO_01823 [Streptomyces chrestomyceticus JCM 4735]